MKYFIDTEFHEYKKGATQYKGVLGINTIELISIALICDDDRHYYAVSSSFDVEEAWEHEWLRENVLESIYWELNTVDGRPYVLQALKEVIWEHGKPDRQIRDEIKMFTGVSKPDIDMDISTENIQFFGYYADYDWVVFCWLFGTMMQLPSEYPKYCTDLKQMMDQKKLTSKWKEEYCPDPEGEHNALTDARWNKQLYQQMQDV